jgi:hypothetical protein
MHVLDFGCGMTNLKSALDEKGIHPASVSMVDVNPEVKKANPDAIILDGEYLNRRFHHRSQDIVLALASTFQIPPAKRKAVFGKLMDVANHALHIGPIFQDDFESLTDLCTKKGFEMIACLPFAQPVFQTLRGKELIFEPARLTDYDGFVQKYPQDTRIVKPFAKNPVVHFRLGFYYIDINSGSSHTILRRKNSEPVHSG